MTIPIVIFRPNVGECDRMMMMMVVEVASDCALLSILPFAFRVRPFCMLVLNSSCGLTGGANVVDLT